MHVSRVPGWVKSLSSSLLSTTFFPAALPLTSTSLLADPFSPDAPCKEEEDSSTVLCPAWGVAWTVLHIINLGITQQKNGLSAAYTWSTDINPQQKCRGKAFRCLYWPATIAEDEEQNTENDAGDADVNPNYDACSGCFAVLIFFTVTRRIQHWGETTHYSQNVTCVYEQESVRREQSGWWGHWVWLYQTLTRFL